MEGVFVVFAVIAGVAFVAVAWTFHFSRAQSILRQWAEENGYEIISSEHRWLLTGPFWWRKSEHQAVYYVTVRTRGGQVRRGWIRCGGWFLGLWSNAADVEWDE
jgi:hypothetical protein